MSSRHLLIGGLALLALGGALLYLDASVQNFTVPAVHEFVLIAENGKLVSGPSELRVNEGDTVTIKITNSEKEEFHLHGYDRSIDLEPKQEASLTLAADMSGNYPFELEHSKVDLGTLIVAPK